MARSGDGRYKDLPQRTTYTPRLQAAQLPTAANDPRLHQQQGQPLPPQDTSQYRHSAEKANRLGQGGNYSDVYDSVQARAGAFDHTIEKAAAAFGISHPHGHATNWGAVQGTQADTEAKQLKNDVLARSAKVITGDPTRSPTQKSMRSKPATLPTETNSLSGNEQSPNPRMSNRRMNLDASGQIPEAELNAPLRNPSRKLYK